MAGKSGDGFNLDNYVPVKDRLVAFWARVGAADEAKAEVTTSYTTELRPDGTTAAYVVTATVTIGTEDRVSRATGMARQEILTKPPITKAGRENVYAPEYTSPLEVAETSAVGRALAFLGFEVSKGIASRDEVARTQRAAASADPHEQAWQETYRLGIEKGLDDAGVSGAWLAALKAAGVKAGKRADRAQASEVLTLVRSSWGIPEPDEDERSGRLVVGMAVESKTALSPKEGTT